MKLEVAFERSSGKAHLRRIGKAGEEPWADLARLAPRPRCWLYRVEAARLRRYERELIGCAAQMVVCHQREAATLDSGEQHANAGSGYNERRRECARACELLGISTLRDAGPEAAARLPDPLDRRVRHVIEDIYHLPDNGSGGCGGGDL